ncbi:MAG: FliH/SctL family protein [Comamonas sp.]
MSNGSHSRFIPSEEIDSSSVVQWRFGAVGNAGMSPILPLTAAATAAAAEPLQDVEVVEATASAPQADAAQLEQLLQQAREQAHAEGRAAGLAQGRAEATNEWQQRMDGYTSGAGRETAQRMQALVEKCEDSLQALEQNMASEVLQLACDIARQVVRQELACKPEALLPVVREALDMLVTEGRAVTVRLNPVDWEVLDAPLRAEHGGTGKLQWLADASVPAGDVRVDSGGAVIEAGLDSRWRRAVAALGLVSSWYEGGHGE